MNNLIVDTNNKKITIDGDEISLHTKEGFEAVRQLWEYTNWANKYSYNFTWLGRPIIQLPDDMIRIQEIIFSVKPTIIIETGVAHGGSLIFYASLLKLMGQESRVVGVDIEIRSHNRQAIESHDLSSMIALVEGSSTDEDILKRVKNQIRSHDKVLVILDSCHTKGHVLEELNAYAPFVSKESYLIVADGIMQHVVGAPRTQEDWSWDNPQEAIKDFLTINNKFEREQWHPLFKESEIDNHATYYQGGFLRRNIND